MITDPRVPGVTEWLKKLEECLRLCTNGNGAAYDYLSVIMKSHRLVDDLFDEIESWTGDNTYALAQLLLVDLPANTFFHANSTALLPHHLTVLNAWRDSNDWKKSGDRPKEVHATVISQQTVEIFILVAYLTGGYEHMRKVSLKVRELFLEEDI